MFQTCFECGRRGQVLQCHPLPISPDFQTPENWDRRDFYSEDRTDSKKSPEMKHTNPVTAKRFKWETHFLPVLVSDSLMGSFGKGSLRKLCHNTLVCSLCHFSSVPLS